MKKRLLVLSLILSLILNQFAISALAETSTATENLDYAQKLQKIGVFIGSDKGFELNRPATRLEGIIMLIRLLGDEDEALDTHYDIPFNDVPTWATPYVSYAYNYGLSNGVSDTEFGSMDELTNDQYFTFMARALGYLDSEGDFVWNESITFMQELGFINDDEASIYNNKSFLRSDIAKLSYKLMSQPVKGSMLLLVNQLLQSGDIDADIATEIGIYTPIQTERESSSTISKNELTFNYNTVAIDESIQQGFPSPYAVPITTSATSNPEEVINFSDNLSGQSLFDSLTHKGFSDVIAYYNATDITWYDFLDNIQINESPYTLDVMIQNNDFYEYKVIDQFEQQHHYYTEAQNIYYEVNEIYMGNYLEPIENLTKETYGTMVYMQAFKTNDYPSYNPLVLTSDETLLYISFTTLNDETVLYLEKDRNKSFVQQWISLKEGIVVKEYIFDDEGVIKSIKNIKSISHETNPDSSFEQPDIEYFDLTLILYALSYDNLQSLEAALAGTFSEEPFSFDLKANGQVKYQVHVNGYDGGDEFNGFGYISQGIDSLGHTLELRQFYDDELFHTIVPSLKTDEVVEDSIERLMLFDLDELSFRDFYSEENIDIYTFENTHYKGLSGLAEYYDYKINTTSHTLESITKYLKEDINSTEFINETVYTFDNFGSFDESLFDIPVDYQILTRPNEVYYDGESPYAWYYSSEQED